MLRSDFDRVREDCSLWHVGEVETERDALREAVREAVTTALTQRQREVVEMHFFEGATQGEIARRLGVSQQVVQKCLHGVTRGGRSVGGALRRLREVLAPEMQP